MLVGWLLIEIVLVVFSVGMIWPRLAIRVPRRLRFGRWKRPAQLRSPRKAVIEAAIGLVLIGLVLTDWSGLRLGWQGTGVATRTSGKMVAGRTKLIDAIFTPPIRSGEQIGIVVGVIDHGVTWTRGYGRSKAGSSRPPDGDCVFEIGSITKTFTCTALAAMCVAGKMDLQDPMTSYFPDGVRIPTHKGKQIRLVDLATHTSGLPRIPDNMGLASDLSGDPYAQYAPEDSYECLKEYMLTRAPGARYEYSNFGMGLLGLALSRRSDKSYEQTVTQLVCVPLGMRDTSVTLSHEQKARLVQGYALQKKVGRLMIAVPSENWTFQDSFAGAGALRSSANDMLKYLRANIDAGATGVGPALAMTHVARHRIDDSMSIGLGWHTLNVPWSKEPIIWHNGGTGGYRSFVGFCPKRKLGVVVLGNTSEDVDLLALRALKSILSDRRAR